MIEAREKRNEERKKKIDERRKKEEEKKNEKVPFATLPNILPHSFPQLGHVLPANKK